MSQDITFTMRPLRFPKFSAALAGFNERTKRLNAKLKKAKFATVNRFPVSENVAKDQVVVCLKIKNRARVLFQELMGIVEDYTIKHEKNHAH